MKKEIEFPELGKESHFEVPDGFFESISEKTLQMAKERERFFRKRKFLWLTLAAASLLILFTLGALIQNSSPTLDSNLIAVATTPVQNAVPSVLGTSENQTAKIKTSNTEISKSHIDETTRGNNNEAINDVLNDLTDDELQLILAMYKADPFLSESAQ